MRLAYFSPLTPQRSGISDYSEELLPYLAEEAEITLFVDGFQPSNAQVTAQFDVRDYRKEPSVLQTLTDFDALLYHFGNDHRYHAGMLEVMRERPGVVVFHDFALQDFFLGLARASRDLRVYLEEVATCHGEEARAEAAETLARGGTPAMVSRPVEFPLNCRLARSGEGIVVHSEWSRIRFAAIAPGIPIARIPMPMEFGNWPPQQPASRDEVRIASFGLITPGKGIDHALRALANLKAAHRFRYTLVGEPNSFFDVRDLIRRYRLEERVDITGHVSLDEFKRRIEQTDLALNIRERTVGETSASLCRLMAAGVCSIVSDVGWYSELPGDSVVKVPLDSSIDVLLAAYITRLVEDAPLRRQIGENARRHAQREHVIERVATEYLNFIGDVISRRTQRQFISNIKDEVARLGVRSTDESFLRGVAQDVAMIAPSMTPTSNKQSAMRAQMSPNGKQSARETMSGPGRAPKIPGIDYKQAARDYLNRIPEERRYHLRTKPFYNLANKPVKYKAPAMDEDTHRHFCDFANIAMMLALDPGSRILDVGCGSGWLSEYFARLGYIVKGIDISPDLIQMSRERLARVPYGVDHETPLRCTFAVHDIELAPLDEKFDAIICYDALHHFEDEHSVVRNLSAMLRVGAVLFILEGARQTDRGENELRAVMREFGTLECPFDANYLRELLDENGLAVIGDYVSVNGLFDRERFDGHQVLLKNLDTSYHYLLGKKVVEHARASTVSDSRMPHLLIARMEIKEKRIERLSPGEMFELSLEIQNTGDTLWLAGREPHPGIVMPAVRILDQAGQLVTEFHGEPGLPHAVAPGETVEIKIEYAAPQRTGVYTLKVDLVDQHICWFEEMGSRPLVVNLEVV
jgi:2-polyprenyl-3-methyl-5-hydroxy-6-metoxy-1,4-benzoquinol methylase/glycosyltransferase involved in cell wall biosynthesis